MILDANTIESGSVLNTTFCVIGSGMGGSAVAQKLAADHRDVLLVEAGGLETHDEATAPVAIEHGGRPFRRPPTRCIELGGTSNQWHGICAPLDAADFEGRPWVPGSGWPVSRSELSRFYADAAVVQGVGQPDSLEGPGAFAEEIKAIDFDASVVAAKLIQFRKSPRRWKNTLLDLVKNGKLRCVLNAPALELVVDADATKIERLIVGAGTGTFSVVAKVFILCAGALETPRLLLNSRSRLATGLGNAHDQVGRNLLDHPAGHFGKLKFHPIRRANIYAGVRHGDNVQVMAALRLSSAEQHQQQVPNHYFMVRPALTRQRIDDELRLSFLSIRTVRDLTWRRFTAVLSNPDILHRVLVTRLGVAPIYRYGDLFFFTEQLPNPDSRVRLSSTRVDRHGYPVARVEWLLSQADLKGFEAYTQVLFERGLRSSRYHLSRRDTLELWDNTVASAAHHLGTARMADTPRHGVVDRDLKVFGVTNLFIGDGSVFTTAGSTNPSLTITALALRLAESLSARELAIPVRPAFATPTRETFK